MKDASGNKFLIRRIRELSRPMTVESTGLESDIRPLKGIRAVLFDVYGTLLISGSGDVGTAAASPSDAAMHVALTVAGCEPEPAAGPRGAELMLQNIAAAHARKKAAGIEFPEIAICEIWEMILARLLKERLIGLRPAAALLEPLAVEYECRVNPVWPMPGFPEVLRELDARIEAMGIVSNAQFYTPLAMEALSGFPVDQLGFRTDLSVYSFRAGRAKPSPQLFQQVLVPLERNYGIAASEALYVGNDMLNDIQTAARAGCRTALFAGDARSLRLRNQKPADLYPRPDLIITNLLQLPRALA